MPASTSVLKQNQELARRINEEVMRDPQSPYAGKFVGIVGGAVAFVADNLNEFARRLRDSGVDPGRTFCLEVGVDYDTPQEIWALSECPV